MIKLFLQAIRFGILLENKFTIMIWDISNSVRISYTMNRTDYTADYINLVEELIR